MYIKRSLYNQQRITLYLQYLVRYFYITSKYTVYTDSHRIADVCVSAEGQCIVVVVGGGGVVDSTKYW